MRALSRIIDGILPAQRITAPVRVLYALVCATTVLLLWQLGGTAIPKPVDVLRALGTLWSEQGLFDHLTTSFMLNAEAIAWSSALSLPLAYLTVLPAARPFVTVLSSSGSRGSWAGASSSRSPRTTATSSSCGCSCSG